MRMTAGAPSGSFPSALTIAGSDSSGGAGIQADLRTFAALQVHGCSAITAVTAQNTRGVRSVFALPPALVAEQIDAAPVDVNERIGRTEINTEVLCESPEEIEHKE